MDEQNTTYYVYRQGDEGNFYFYSGPHTTWEAMDKARCEVQDEGRTFSVETFKQDRLLYCDSSFYKERD